MLLGASFKERAELFGAEILRSVEAMRSRRLKRVCGAAVPVNDLIGRRDRGAERIAEPYPCLFFRAVSHREPQYFSSRPLYWTASSTCAFVILASPEISAMVRATFMTLVYALTESFSFS